MSRGTDCQTRSRSLFFCANQVFILPFISGLDFMHQLHPSTGCTPKQAYTHIHVCVCVCVDTNNNNKSHAQQHSHKTQEANWDQLV